MYTPAKWSKTVFHNFLSLHLQRPDQKDYFKLSFSSINGLNEFDFNIA